jgi:hypothetical protein
MDMAAQLANAHAAVLLRALMEGDGPTALQAIKLFLTTHAPEYKERQTIEVSIDHQEVVRVIRTNLYGLGNTVDEFEGSSLPILDADDAAVEEAEASKWIEPLLALPEPPEVPKPPELIEPMRETVLEPASGPVFPLPIPPTPPAGARSGSSCSENRTKP